jgi:ABC-type Co2+ transport system permease subunit
VRRRIFQYLWFAAVAAWACLRILAVDTWLTKYGVNTAVFAVVEISSSVPYGIGSARCVTNLVDRHRRAATLWGLVAAAGFVAPDFYLLSAGKSMPLPTYVIILVVLLTLGTISVMGIIRKYQQSRIL